MFAGLAATTQARWASTRIADATPRNRWISITLSMPNARLSERRRDGRMTVQTRVDSNNMPVSTDRLLQRVTPASPKPATSRGETSHRNAGAMTIAPKAPSHAMRSSR